MALWQTQRAKNAAEAQRVAERLAQWDDAQSEIAACGSDPVKLQAYKARLQERTRNNPYLRPVS